MPVNQVRNDLWTPDGPVALQRDVQTMTKQDLGVFARCHELAHKFKIELRCAICGSPFQGNNNDASKVFAVQCRCREIRYTP